MRARAARRKAATPTPRPKRFRMSVALTDRRNWVQDTQADACTQCNSEFSVLLRRVGPSRLRLARFRAPIEVCPSIPFPQHHCRQCGLIYCHSCCVKRPGVGKRICDACWRSSVRAIAKSAVGVLASFFCLPPCPLACAVSCAVYLCVCVVDGSGGAASLLCVLCLRSPWMCCVCARPLVCKYVCMSMPVPSCIYACVWCL